MHVEHFMTKNPVACDANEPVEGVARLMRDKGVGCVVVLRHGRVAGLVTDRQLAVCALAEGLGPDTPVEEVMTADPACLTEEDNLFSAIDTMRSAGVVRRLPVVNANKELLGIVSIADLAPVAKDLIDAILLEELHHSSETHVLTGAKRVVKEIRRPTKLDKLKPEQESRPVTEATPAGLTAGGGAGNPPGTRARRSTTPNEEGR